ncbi:decarboxylating 6-phosphogluconate dehydrogenase [Pseudonocardia sp. ICBG1122]|nr:decarboxylating 6-phosphogluconate dehydrogenase [Pseudonocardia pini]
MQIGMIGLGRMGGNMRERLRAAGHEVVGYDPRPEVSDVASLAELAGALAAPRVVWVMVPSGEPTRNTVATLATTLEPGDLVIDGGNSRYTDDQPNAALLDAHGIGYVDCGVSGGIWGKDNGYGLMAGGEPEHIERAMPIFDALRPEGVREEGFAHAGPVGAGHFAKMVHNGIEYGLMQAYAEGFELMEASELITDVPGVIQAWSRGTVVRSWLLDLLVDALKEDPRLDQLEGWVDDSGEGRWTIEEAIAHAVPLPVISAALFARFSSRQAESPAMKAVAALRQQFGGHAVKKSRPARRRVIAASNRRRTTVPPCRPGHRPARTSSPRAHRTAGAARRRPSSRATRLPGGEPGEQRRGDDRQRHRVRDGLLDRPAALAGVVHPALELVETGVLLERVDQQVEQPGTDDGAARPCLDHPGHVGDQLAGLHQLEALGVGLHEAVLDAVVDHLREVARAYRPGVREPLLAHALGAQRVEDRHGALDVLGLAARHQAVAVVLAPDPARDAAVDVADAVRVEQRGVGLVVGVAGVAAVDDQVTGLQRGRQRGDGVPGRLAGGHHDPHDARRGQRTRELRERGHVTDLRAGVVADHLVPGGPQPLPHVAAHAAESDHADLHGSGPLRVRAAGMPAGHRWPSSITPRTSLPSRRDARPAGGQPGSRTGISRCR